MKVVHSRRVRRKGNLDVYDPTDHVLVIDSACDQSIIPASACLVLSSTNEYFHVDGALNGMTTGGPLQVKNVTVLVNNPYNNDKIIGIINQALYDRNPHQYEALLQLNQARSHGTAIVSPVMNCCVKSPLKGKKTSIILCTYF